MATTTTGADYINKMYDSSLSSQKAQLETDYNQNVSDLDAQQQKNQKQTDTNLTRTYVEAAKNAKNYAETQNAHGLTSGAMAQAKLAQNNQMQSDMTTIRAAQQTADAEIQREKGLLAQQYSAAIAKAQADNDMARAKALYEQAQADDERLLQQQKEAAKLMASVGDYSLYQALYGLTDEQMEKLQGVTDGASAGSLRYIYDDGPADDEPTGTAANAGVPAKSKVPIVKEAGGASLVGSGKGNLSNLMGLYK